MKPGLFIVLEGIDGSGKGVQMNRLHDYIKSLSKYNDVLTTHEPWGNDEIKRILREEKDAYSSAEKVLELFLKDRANHLEKLIKPALRNGVHVICDRYSLSTFAYQNAQGVAFDYIRKKHEEMGIINPDITYLLNISLKTSLDRVRKRGGSLEKFEKDKEFVQKVIENYLKLTEHPLNSETQRIFGAVKVINGEYPEEKVFEEIKRVLID